MIRPVTPAELEALLGDGTVAGPAIVPAPARVFDVRPAAAYAAGHIDGADHLPHEQAVRWIPQQVATQQLVVLVDDDGAAHGPAREVAAELAHHWFRQLRYLAGGVAAWRGAGLPLVQGGVAGITAASHDGTRGEFHASAPVPWDAPGPERALDPLGPRRRS